MHEHRLPVAPLLCLLLWVGCSSAHDGADTLDAGPPGTSWQAAPAHLVSQYRRTAEHRGDSPPGTELTLPLQEAWRSEPLAIGDYTASKSSPVVDEELVYVGMDSGLLYGIERASGQVAWDFATHRHGVELEASGTDNRGIHATPAFDGQHVYVGDYLGFLYAVDKGDGSLVWETKLAGSIGASPVLHEGVIYMAVEYPIPDGRVMGVDTRDGSLVFNTPYLGDHPHSSASLDPARGLLFVGDNSGQFHAYNYESESTRWVYQTGDAIKATAAVVDDVVYITSWDYGLHALDVDSGEALFTYFSGWASMSSPSYHEGLVFFGSYDAKLHAVDARTGERRWVHQTGADLRSSPTVVQDSDLVVVGSADGSVHILDAQTGELLQELVLGAEITSVPVAVEDQLYVADNSGVVWRFDSAAP